MGACRSIGGIRVDWLTLTLHGVVRPELRDELLELTATAYRVRETSPKVNSIPVPPEVPLDGLREIVSSPTISTRPLRRQGGLVHRIILQGAGWSVWIHDFDPCESGFGNCTVEVTGQVEDVRGLASALVEWLGDFHKSVTRIDLAADFDSPEVFGSMVDALYKGHYVCRGRSASIFFDGGVPSGAVWSSRYCRCTVYDKRREQQLPPDSPAWYRVEFQIKSEMFRRSVDRSEVHTGDDELFAEAFAVSDPECPMSAVGRGILDTACLQGIFRYLTSSWLRILDGKPDRVNKNQSKVKTMPEWASLSDFPVARGEAVPVVKRAASMGTIVRAAAGLLAFAGALNSVPESSLSRDGHVVIRGNGRAIMALVALLETGKLEGVKHEISWCGAEPITGGNDGRPGPTGQMGLDSLFAVRFDSGSGQHGVGSFENARSEVPRGCIAPGRLSAFA